MIEITSREDGYINATLICKQVGKKFGHFNELKSTKEYLTNLATELAVESAVLVQSSVGGTVQGTWVHPQVAIKLGYWISNEIGEYITATFGLPSKAKEPEVEANETTIKEFNNFSFRFLNGDSTIYIRANDILSYLSYSGLSRSWSQIKATNPSISSSIKICREMSFNGKHYNVDYIDYPTALFIIQKADKGTLRIKKDLIHFLNEAFEVKDKATLLVTRGEVEFLSLLKAVFLGLGLHMEYQYSVDNYRLDFYVPELNLAIEYDEYSHQGRKSQDEVRQLYLEKNYNLKFIRVPDRPSDALALVMSYLYSNNIISINLPIKASI